jgi:LacI family gluconate utilization system Gnt-I transcriptional repressor
LSQRDSDVIVPRGATVKITDVAAAAGVAPMTVSRVLNTPDRVSASTALRVRDAIERLGYVPNLIAGGLSSRRSRMVAAIVPTIASPMFSQPIQVFTDALARAGYHVMLSLSGYGDEGEDALIRAVLTRRPDGLLLTGVARTPGVRRLLADAGIPVIEIWDMAERHTDMLVGFDHAEVGAAVADFFTDKGHTHFMVFHAGDPRARARAAGFGNRVAHHGGTMIAERVLPSPSGIGDGRRALHEVTPLLKPGTALLCSSDLVAFGAMTEAQALGIAVPSDLAICGFGDFELGREAATPLTTVQVDGEAIGRLAAERLLARMSTPAAASGDQIIVPFRIIARDST